VAVGDSDPAAGRVSVESPIGEAMIGRAIGETVTVSTPKGERSYRILDANPYIAAATPENSSLSAPAGRVQSPPTSAPTRRSSIEFTPELLSRPASESPDWLPQRIAHADWGTAASKCIVATAELHDGIYHAQQPRAVLAGHGLIERMRLVSQDSQSTLLGFDFPLGVPRAYAQLAGITNFADWFRQLDLDSPFFEVASGIDEVSIQQPFFPRLITTKSTGIQARFHQALGLTAEQMLRRCDRPHCGHGGASPMFWALGPKAVAKMTLAGWRNTIRPALAEPRRLYTIWPFDGPMAELLEGSDAVIVETYPRDAYLQLGLKMGLPGTAKTKQADRAADAPCMFDWCVANAVRPEDRLSDQITGGFGDGKDGEDQFDAVVGLFGMIDAMRRASEPELPDDPQVRLVEGWMFGRHATCPA
jgi:Transcription elongation factor, GreA/GreB, C-term